MSDLERIRREAMKAALPNDWQHYYPVEDVKFLLKTIDELKETVTVQRYQLKFHDQFLSALRGTILKAQGIEKNKPLRKKAPH